MPRTVINILIASLQQLANTGVTDEINSRERNKTRILNICILVGIPVNVFFVVLNFLQGRLLLSGINLFLVLNGILVLMLNKYQHRYLGRVIVCCISGLLFFVSSVLFKNGTEASIMALMIVIILFFDETRMVIGLTVYYFALLIAIKVFSFRPAIIQSVPEGRAIFNTIWSLLLVILCLFFLKKDQRSYQLQIEKNNRDLENLNETKEKLFSIIAHDLRSPIGQLRTLLELVNAKSITVDKFKEMTAKLASEVDQLHNTMDSLLKWSTSQSQGIRAIPEKIDLPDLLEQTINFFRQKAEQKNIRLLVDGPKLSVWADRDHLELIVRNLVSNAIKFSYAGGIILVRSYAKEDQVIIQVVDQGMGIPEELSSTIFSAANIISHTGTANEKGTGLGLKLCKEFVENNHGRIWVESEEKKGSTFSISLPAAK
jgi:signal transduction histidine kinase